MGLPTLRSSAFAWSKRKWYFWLSSASSAKFELFSVFVRVWNRTKQWKANLHTHSRKWSRLARSQNHLKYFEVFFFFSFFRCHLKSKLTLMKLFIFHLYLHFFFLLMTHNWCAAKWMYMHRKKWNEINWWWLIYQVLLHFIHSFNFTIQFMRRKMKYVFFLLGGFFLKGEFYCLLIQSEW